MALNPIVHYQQFAHHIHQQLPTLLTPIFQLDPSSPTRPVEEEPLDHEKSSEYMGLHTLIDYQPWLKRLYQNWQQALLNEFHVLGIKKSLSEPDHWHPESTARAINAIALAYSGHLMHVFKQDPIVVIDRTTLLWRHTWHTFRQELDEQHTQTPILQAIDKTGYFFQQFWLESWLHIAELHNTLPTNPTENSPKMT